MSELKTAPAQITPQWLTDTLRRNGHLSQGKVVSVDIKEAHKHHFALAVTYSADVPNSPPQDLILKWYSGDYPYGLQEALFFDQIAPAMSSPPLPTCYAAKADWANKQAYILLEDLSATHYVAQSPYDDLSMEIFEQVVDAYAEIHAYWWEHPRINQRDILRAVGVGIAHEAISPETIRHNQQYFGETALPKRIDQFAAQFSREQQKLCQRVIASWADLFIHRIASGKGLTLIQGDAQLGNVLLPRNPQRDRTIIIDWEGCIRGVGVWDLARTLIQTEFSSPVRQKLERALLTRYQARLAEQGICYSIEDCYADYRLSVIANIPHALSYEGYSYLESAIRAFRDWNCEKLLDDDIYIT
ncbi:MAG: phosphotransferase [Chloroflexota bacterium]